MGLNLTKNGFKMGFSNYILNQINSSLNQIESDVFESLIHFCQYGMSHLIKMHVFNSRYEKKLQKNFMFIPL